MSATKSCGSAETRKGRRGLDFRRLVCWVVMGSIHPERSRVEPGLSRDELMRVAEIDAVLAD